jgi:hypothetical protein
MKLISTDEVIEKANVKYAQAKMDKSVDLRYTAPEAMPKIQSDQVKAIAEALVEEVNVRLAALSGWEA